MPLARVGVRADSTTSYSYNARRGQLPRTRIGIVHRTRARHAVCAEGLHFSAFHIILFSCTYLPRLYLTLTLFLSLFDHYFFLPLSLFPTLTSHIYTSLPFFCPLSLFFLSPSSFLCPSIFSLSLSLLPLSFPP